MRLTTQDLQRGWYPCPRCRAEVMVWPMAGDTEFIPGEPNPEPQKYRDLCADCDEVWTG